MCTFLDECNNSRITWPLEEYKLRGLSLVNLQTLPVVVFGGGGGCVCVCVCVLCCVCVCVCVCAHAGHICI